MTNLFKQKFMKVPNLTVFSSIKEIGRNAYVDWIIILITSTVIMFALFIGGLYLYWEITTGNYEGAYTEEKKDEKIIDINRMDAILSAFQIRSDITQKNKQRYSGPTDPSK